MSALRRGIFATVLFAGVLLSGCAEQPQERPKAYPAVVIGSGCSTWGCISAVRITHGPHKYQVRHFENMKLNIGDSVYTWVDAQDGAHLY